MRNRIAVVAVCLSLALAAALAPLGISAEATEPEAESEEAVVEVAQTPSQDVVTDDDPLQTDVIPDSGADQEEGDSADDSGSQGQGAETGEGDEEGEAPADETGDPMEGSDDETGEPEEAPAEVSTLSADPEPRAITSMKPMYRLYNPNSGEHFYTASNYEARSLVSAGWRYEGVGWMAPATSSAPVYRLYNPNAGDHHYTTSAYERDHLKSVGWRDEGIGWYSDDAKTVPLLRQYNPNARAGAHNFTASTYERDSLVKAGWRDEGIGWYGSGSAGDDPAHGLLTRTPIVGDSTASASTMAAYFKAMGRSYPSDVYSAYGAGSIDDFCRILEEEAKAEGVNPAVVFAQAMVETNNLRFGGQVSAAQCNFASLGVTGDNARGTDFSSYGSDAVRMGLRAQVQHLKAYATDAPLKNACVDAGYDAVPKGSAAYVELLGSGVWSGDSGYASKIVKILDAYAPTFVTSSEKSYSAVYNYEFYRTKYPDIAAAFGDDRAATLNHFLTLGVRERRQACATFSVQSYYNQYEDVRRAYGTNMLAICRHYIQYGKSEGRAGTGCSTLQGSWQYHNVAWAGQPNGYWCGPASGYMILRNVGANTSASGTPLTMGNVASYMGTTTSGTSFANRAFANGMNNWLGKSVYTTVHTPSYSTVRAAILDSYNNGYASAVDTQERRGGPHLNGHSNSTFSHIMVVDAYNLSSDTATIVDPGAGTIWGASAQKFSVNLNYLVTQFMQKEVFFDREHIGLHYAR